MTEQGLEGPNHWDSLTGIFAPELPTGLVETLWELHHGLRLSQVIPSFSACISPVAQVLPVSPLLCQQPRCRQRRVSSHFPSQPEKLEGEPWAGDTSPALTLT